MSIPNGVNGNSSSTKGGGHGPSTEAQEMLLDIWFEF